MILVAEISVKNANDIFRFLAMFLVEKQCRNCSLLEYELWFIFYVYSYTRFIWRYTSIRENGWFVLIIFVR